MQPQCESTAKIDSDEPISVAEKPAPDADFEEPARVRIPLRIDDGMVVCAPTGPRHIASCRIVGAAHGEFILITEPTVKISDRFSAVLDDHFLCSYFCDGYLYTFQSRYRNRLMNDIISIEYPKEVGVRQIRKDRRIKVNIETKVFVCENGEPFLADMTDISRGGCCLVFKQHVPMEQGSNVLLTFSLPNNALIRELQAVAVRVRRVKNSKKIEEAGLSFAGQGSEICKVADFCEFCMYFDLD